MLRSGAALAAPLLLLAAGLACVRARELRVTGVAGNEASDTSSGAETGLEFDTLHNALAAAASGAQPRRFSCVRAAVFAPRTAHSAAHCAFPHRSLCRSAPSLSTRPRRGVV